MRDLKMITKIKDKLWAKHFQGTAKQGVKQVKDSQVIYK